MKRPNKQRIWLLFFFCGLLTSLASLHISAEGESLLTLDQAIEMSLKSNIQVQIARNDLGKAQAAVQGEVWKFFPTAKVDGEYQYDITRDIYPKGFTISVSGTIPTNVNLYGKKVASNLEAAVWDRVNSELQLRLKEAESIKNTTTKYIAVIKAMKVCEIQEIGAKNAEAVSNLAKEQLRLGKITKSVQLKAESDLATANFNLKKSRQDLNLALLQLKNQIGLEDTGNIVCTEEGLVKTGQTVDPVKMKDELLKKRLELQQVQISVRKAERILYQAKNQTLPSVDIDFNRGNGQQYFSVSYNFLSGDLAWNGGYRDQTSGVKYRDETQNPFEMDKRLTLKMTWTFDLSTILSTGEQARLDVDTAIKNKQQKETDIRLEWEQADSDYEMAKLKTESTRENLAYYQQELAVRKVEYNTGGVTRYDLSLAELDALQAQVDMVSAEYDLLAAMETLKWVSGQLYNFK